LARFIQSLAWPQTAHPVKQAQNADRPSRLLLRRHLDRRSAPHICERDLLRERRERKIRDLHFPPAIDPNVGRLDIAMHNAALMCREQSRADLAGKLGALSCESRPMRLRGDNRSSPSGYSIDVKCWRCKVLALDKTDVVNTADVRMRHLSRDAYFIPEPAERRFGHVSFGQELQCDGLIDDKVICAVHLPHPASPRADREHDTAPQARSLKTSFLDTVWETGCQIGCFGLDFWPIEPGLTGWAHPPAVANLAAEALGTRA
jgi:hypothetical protein